MVKEALREYSSSDDCSHPKDGRSQVLQWGHSSKVACHPGVHRTLAQQRFWWPSMSSDTKEFILACSVSARSKSSHRAPAGLLQPLPIPHPPWLHIAVDFVSGLLISEGNTTMLTIVDHFSKAVPFIPQNTPNSLSLSERQPASFTCVQTAWRSPGHRL